MSFRRRMVLLAAGAVAAAVLLASAVVFVVTRKELSSQIDASLRQKLTPGQPEAVKIRLDLSPAKLAKLRREARSPPGPPTPLVFAVAAGNVSFVDAARSAAGAALVVSAHGLPVPIAKNRRSEELSAIRKITLRWARSTAQRSLLSPPAGTLPALVLPHPNLGGPTGYVQLYQTDGQVLVSAEGGQSLLPVTSATRAVAAGRRDTFFSDATVAGTRVRILTERAPPDGVWQAALPLTDLDSTLTHLKLVLAIVSAGGIALAAALGLLVSRAALVPVRRLTGAAEQVARTQDLGHRIDVDEEDELGRLAASFNTMLAALERSRLAQRQLVSDASHELRTPLTSIQTNLDALALGERLPAGERADILAAAQAQLRELTVLVGDLVDLSKTEVDQIEVEAVRLDLAVAGALERARLHAPQCRFVLTAEPCLVRAGPARLDRAIANLLDNAIKWGPSAGPVEVCVGDGALHVRDHGPGIADEDLPRVFDRFYRAPAARERPGSGLGLAIVRQMAESHGGAVHARNDPSGGAILTLELPPLQMTAVELAQSESPAPAPLGVAQQVPRFL
jgi:two-component system, OmpR family, sensor histidine kinase MprB